MSLSEKLFQLLHDLGHLQVEIALIAGACLLLLVGLFRVHLRVVQALFVLILAYVYFQIGTSGEWLFEGQLQTSPLSLAMSRLLIVGTALLVIFPTGKNQRSSYYFLLLCTLFGALWMMQARHFLIVYLAVEMVSFGGYLLTNFSFKKESHEAAIKYLLFGGVASAIMLFGISMLYGANGHLMLAHVGEGAYAQVGAFFVLAGIMFKISAVPFHIWVPNVYQASPPAVAAFLSVVPKLAGLVLLGNVLKAWQWGTELVVALGMLTIIVGTLGAVRQHHVRRLVSYGAIAHTGFLLAFVLWPIPSEAFVWYSAIYMVMSVAVFYLLACFEEEGVYHLVDYGGLGKSLPVVGAFFTLVAVALVGLPPTAGFTAKWLLFSGLWTQYAASGDGWTLTYLVVSVLASAVALFYYLRVPYFMFLQPGERQVSFPAVQKILVGALAVLLLVLFLRPGLLSVF